MAVTIPLSSVRQKDDSLTLGENGAAGLVATFNDAYGTLKTFAETSLKSGVALTLDGETVIVKSYQLRRLPADRGLLSISYAANDTVTAGGAVNQTPLEEIWEVKSVRNDISILAYCGKLEENAANRAFIECWQKEPDSALALAYSYRRPNDSIASVEELGSSKYPTINIIDKILAGRESVMRFYPMLVCTKIYSQFPSDLQSKSAYIDTPSPSASAGTAGLSSFIAAHQWVQGPDECARQSDKTWKRVTTWLGIRNDAVKAPAVPWDPEFYGPDGTRWKIPLTVSDNGS